MSATFSTASPGNLASDYSSLSEAVEDGWHPITSAVNINDPYERLLARDIMAGLNGDAPMSRATHFKICWDQGRSDLCYFLRRKKDLIFSL
jgi:hypothetical protein